MKTAYQILLLMFFTFFFGVIIVASTVKFGLLNYNFLVNVFNKHNVYTNISVSFKNSVESQIGRSGGKIKDIAILTDLITTENTKDFINKNLFNILMFFNGRVSEIYIYIPIDKLPSGILPKNVAGMETQMGLKDFGDRFNVVGFENIPIQVFYGIGLYAYHTLMVSTTLMGIIFILILLSVDSGKRYIIPGISIVVAALELFVLVFLLSNMNDYIVKKFTGDINLNKIVALEIVKPISTEIVHACFFAGVGLFMVGITLFFVKKKAQS